jgi:hypothetical protein
MILEVFEMALGAFRMVSGTYGRYQNVSEGYRMFQKDPGCFRMS